MSDDESYHHIKERCIGNGFEWQLYVQKRKQSARIILEPRSVKGVTAAWNGYSYVDRVEEVSA